MNGFRTETMYGYHITMKSMFLLLNYPPTLLFEYTTLIIFVS
jgi:hypothetical protein